MNTHIRVDMYKQCIWIKITTPLQPRLHQQSHFPQLWNTCGTMGHPPKTLPGQIHS